MFTAEMKVADDAYIALTVLPTVVSGSKVNTWLSPEITSALK
jgi:hypothetical protein